MVFIRSVRTLLNNYSKILFIDFRKSSLEIQCKSHETLLPEANIPQRLLKVAVIGMPNAGKSTFINYLMDRKVCPASSKVHTTRKKSCAIFTENDSQIIFLDTPGLVNDKERKRHKLERSFIQDSRECLQEADIIGVIHDVSPSWHRDRLDIKIINLLRKYSEKPSLLFLNKVDILKSKRKLLDITRLLTEDSLKGKSLVFKKQMDDNTNNTRGWPYFSEVFMISALTGGGFPEVKNYLIKEAKENKWIYPENVWTDQTPEDIILTSVKAKFLDFLSQELPYLLEPYIEYFESNKEGAITTVVLVQCPTERISKLIAGDGGGRLRQITESVQGDLQDIFQHFVRIKIVLEVSKQKL